MQDLLLKMPQWRKDKLIFALLLRVLSIWKERMAFMLLLSKE
jgi:hypothetical protein